MDAWNDIEELPWGGAGTASAPSVTKSGGPHVAWAETDSLGDVSVFYSYQLGEWTSPVLLAGPFPGSGSNAPSVLINTLDDEGRLLVSWLDETSPSPGLYGSVWNLSAWEPAAMLFPGWGVGAVSDHFPGFWEVHFASNTLQPTCPCNDVIYASGTPGSWSAPVSIGTGHTVGAWEWPREISLHVTTDNIPHVIWRHETYDLGMELVDERLILAVNDGGWSFEDAIVVGRNAHEPSVGSPFSGVPAVVWSDDSNGSFDIYLLSQTPPAGVPDGLVGPSAGDLTATVTPNPTRAGAAVETVLPVSGSLRVRIFDARGRAVTVLGAEKFPPGKARLVWDGTNRFGEHVPAGVYFVRIDAGSRSVGRRLVVIP